jgi:hypothetical protein
MEKDELIETIQAKHRQLARYIFFFEKNSAGVFVASGRPKFGVGEMLQPGVFRDWSLKDLLLHLIDWESMFIRWFQTGLVGEVPDDLPQADLNWDSLDLDDFHSREYSADLTIQSVLEEFNLSYKRIFSTIQSIPANVLFTPGLFAWTGDASVADYVALTTFKHYDWAKSHIRLWRKRHAGEYLDKEIILARIKTERRRLVQNLEHLSIAQMQMKGVVGDWSIKDLLAHLADWEQRFLGWYMAGLRGEVPEIPAPGLSWAQLDVLNQQVFEANRTRSLKEIRLEFDQSYLQVLAVVESMPEEEMFAPGRYAWLGENSLVESILANTANHYRWAKEQVRNWLKTQRE